MTQVMGILNVTPDSFSDGGVHDSTELATAHARMLMADGADIIDVGGESTRPGASPVHPSEEQARVLPVIENLQSDSVTISIDTIHAETARVAVGRGATIVNDVSGGTADDRMRHTVAELGVHYVIGHWRGDPTTMAMLASYSNPIEEIVGELEIRISAARAAGIEAERIIIDPGLGFAKSAAVNWLLLRSLPALMELGYPVMIGASRKRFLNDIGTGLSLHDRDAATAAVSLLAAQQGAWAVRVHDVRSTAVALRTVNRWTGRIAGQ